MKEAAFFNDYSYINHSNRKVCFKYEFTKRVKGQVTSFLKENREEIKIVNFLNNLGLKLEKIHTSKKYINYVIKDGE